MQEIFWHAGGMKAFSFSQCRRREPDPPNTCCHPGHRSSLRPSITKPAQRGGPSMTAPARGKWNERGGRLRTEGRGSLDLYTRFGESAGLAPAGRSGRLPPANGHGTRWRPRRSVIGCLKGQNPTSQAAGSDLRQKSSPPSGSEKAWLVREGER